MISNASDVLYARLAGFRCDVAELRRYYRDVVAKTSSTPYKDNGASYVGWAITSRDGTVVDGVQQINMKATGSAAKRGTIPTPLYKGYGQKILEEISAYGIEHFRSRVMCLESEGEGMSFHRDATQPAWRLHVPIVTNPSSFFEWKLDNGRIERAHLAADGSAWLVRVDVMHRAVNVSSTQSERVHLLMSFSGCPNLDQLDGPTAIHEEAGAPVVSESNAVTQIASPRQYPDWASLAAADRTALLRSLPAGGVVAEFGVSQGVFSQKIVDIVVPQKLHLVDPWIYQELPLWQKRSTDFHLDSMRTVQRRFEAEIRARRVLLHQGFSHDMLELFPRAYFDWVYLDGDHRYDTVRKELDLCEVCVKPSGLILGHDFIKPELYPEEERPRLGVVPAVKDFCRQRGWELVFQTPDQLRGSKSCPTFVLRRKSL